MNYSDVRLRVTPQVLYNKADEVSKLIRKMQKQYNIMDEVVAKTSSYWEGQASEAYHMKYQERDEMVEAMFQRFSDTPKRLMQIASQYADVEMRVEEEAFELPGDVLK